MAKQAILFCLVGILVMGGALLTASAEGKSSGEQFSAMIMAVGGAASGGTASLDVWIDKYTTDDEVTESARLLKDKGMDELHNSLNKKDIGRISIANGMAIPIAIARSLKDEKGRVIRIFIARNVTFLEYRGATRSRDYPFSFIELHLSEKGQGEGLAVAGVKIKFNEKDKQIVMESLGRGADTLRLVNVRKP